MTIRPSFAWIEHLFAAGVACGLGYVVAHILVEGFIPPPFFYDTADTWMDWYNTAQFAHVGGAYDNWKSIYPPLSFVFLRFTDFPSCMVGMDPINARHCDWLGAVVFHSFFVLNIYLIGRSYLKSDRRTALPRSIALAAGLPMLNGLDRGNLIIVTFTCFLLAFGPLVKSARLKWLAAALAANFKVYLIAALFPMLLRRRWRWFEGAMLTTVAVYVLTWGIYGSGSPVEIFNNIRDFAGQNTSSLLLDTWNAATYLPAHDLLTNPNSPIILILGSDRIEMFDTLIAIAIHGVQAIVILAAAAAWARPEVVPMNRLTNLAVSLALISAEAGAYTIVVIIFLTLFERGIGVGRRIAIFTAYTLCLPFDMVIEQLDPFLRYSFLANQDFMVSYSVTYGPFIRPGLVLIIPLSLSCVTLRAVWRDIREQGWRDRTRFRFDLPIMLNGGRAPALA